MRKRAGGVRLSFIRPMDPELVEQPPKGDGWSHERLVNRAPRPRKVHEAQLICYGSERRMTISSIFAIWLVGSLTFSIAVGKFLKIQRERDEAVRGPWTASPY